MSVGHCSPFWQELAAFASLPRSSCSCYWCIVFKCLLQPPLPQCMGASSSTPNPVAEEPKMSSFNAVLAEVSTEDLMRELSHRLECTKKPEQRMILIGELA